MAKDTEKINIEVTKQQLEDMLIAAMLYSWIRGGLADSRGEDFRQYEELEHFLLKAAEDNNPNGLVEEFEGVLVPSNESSKRIEQIIEEYEDDVFWHELVTRLGKRDFWRTISDAEREALKKENWLPERVRDLYEKYEHEFEQHGLERMFINGGT